MTVYGLSTEGYSIARKLAAKNVKVFVIDEISSSAILLPPNVAESYSDVAELREGEPLLSLCPAKEAISKAQYLFFTPIIRKHREDVRGEIQSRLKSIAASLSSGCSIVCGFPAGFGDNDDNMNLLEQVTGMEVGKAMSYYYYPLLRHKQPEMVGSLGQDDEILAELLSDGGARKQFATIPLSEHAYAMEIMSRLTQIVSVLEICHIARKNDVGREFLNQVGEIYLDDIADILYDAYALKTSLEGAVPLYYFIGESQRSIKNYIKRIAEGVRSAIKKSKVRANKSSLMLLWDMDRSEMRGEKIALCQDFLSRLEGYVGSISTREELGRKTLRIGETMFILACTRRDFEAAVKAKTEQQIIIKANPLFEVVG